MLRVLIPLVRIIAGNANNRRPMFSAKSNIRTYVDAIGFSQYPVEAMTDFQKELGISSVLPQARLKR